MRLLTGRVCPRGATGSESGCLGPWAPGVYPEIVLIPVIPVIYTPLGSVCCLPLLEERAGEGRGWSAEEEACGTEVPAGPAPVSSPRELVEP